MNPDSMSLDEWEAEVDRIEDEVSAAVEAAAAFLDQRGDRERATAVRQARATAGAPGLAAQLVIDVLKDDTEPELVKQRERLLNVRPFGGDLLSNGDSR
jgi:hypothetical protein